MSKKKQYNRIKLEINLSHLKHNFYQIKQQFSNQKILCVVKNNAYGHGVKELAKVLHEADFFGVADISAAVSLRNQNIKTPLVVMGGIWDDLDFEYGVKNNISFILYEKYQVDIIEKFEKRTNLPYDIWLKIDTGMNRLGIQMTEAKNVIENISSFTNLASITIMTHFANADNLNEKAMLKQLKNWDSILVEIKKSDKSTLFLFKNI